MQKRLSELEQLVMDYVWSHPGCSVTSCQEGLAASRPLKESTVRTLFQRLEAKGYVTHVVDGRTYLYSASQRRSNIAAKAVKQIIDRFCGGSLEELLVGMVDNDIVDGKELQELTQKITAKKQERAR
jgi:BlaI family transcriptional regulator, penicillinase repressor